MGRTLKNAKRKGIAFENAIKLRYARRDYVLVARQARSAFPDLICFGDFIKLVECKAGKIHTADVIRMKKLIQKIIRKQPALAELLYGEIRSPDRVVWVSVQIKHHIVTRELKGDTS